jgi:hypothetical protein
MGFSPQHPGRHGHCRRQVLEIIQAIERSSDADAVIRIQSIAERPAGAASATYATVTLERI